LAKNVSQTKKKKSQERENDVEETAGRGGVTVNI
jgi:hypothetical protein